MNGCLTVLILHCTLKESSCTFRNKTFQHSTQCTAKSQK